MRPFLFTFPPLPPRRAWWLFSLCVAKQYRGSGVAEGVNFIFSHYFQPLRPVGHLPYPYRAEEEKVTPTTTPCVVAFSPSVLQSNIGGVAASRGGWIILGMSYLTPQSQSDSSPICRTAHRGAKGYSCHHARRGGRGGKKVIFSAYLCR